MGVVVDRFTIWQNDTGIVLSNAGNVFVEAGGDARTGWVPSETNRYAASSLDFSVAANVGTAITGQSTAALVARPVDTIRGYPQHRLEHYFRIKVPSGADRCYFEWRGESTVDSTGFTLTDTTTNMTRIWWYSKERAGGYGTFWEDNDLAYAMRPINVAWSSANTNKLHGPPAGTTTSDDFTGSTLPGNAVYGFPLIFRGMAPFAASGESTNFRFWMAPHSWVRTPWGSGDVNLGHGGLLWGYSSVAGAVDTSRYPKAGDKYGWVYECGYPVNAAAFIGGQSNSAMPVRLSVAGLEYIYPCFRTNGPVTGANTYNPGAGNETYKLDFTNASMTVRGRIKCIFVSETAGH